MKLTELTLPGAFVIDIEPQQDERGFFARTWCIEELAAAGIDPTVVQSSISHNARAGTLRGMHFQRAPHAENKFVRCTKGEIWDAIVDLRTESPARGRWVGVALSEDNRRSLFVPKGLAHGFVTLRDDTEVFYQISQFYMPGSSAGFRWDDAVVGIDWPRRPAVISERDATLPLLSDLPIDPRPA